jgi:hypothetical protein
MEDGLAEASAVPALMAIHNAESRGISTIDPNSYSHLHFLSGSLITRPKSRQTTVTACISQELEVLATPQLLHLPPPSFCLDARGPNFRECELLIIISAGMDLLGFSDECEPRQNYIHGKTLCENKWRIISLQTNRASFQSPPSTIFTPIFPTQSSSSDLSPTKLVPI